jgi:hypothetical protein
MLSPSFRKAESSNCSRPDDVERVLLYITSEKHLRPFGRYLLSEARSGSVSPSAVQSDLLSKYEKKLRK